MAFRPLGLFAQIKPVANTEQDGIIIQEDQARTVMHVRRAARFGGEDLLEIHQGAILEAAAAQLERIVARRALRPGQIDQSIGRKVRVQDHVEQTTLAGIERRRHTCDRRIAQGAIAIPAQGTRFFRDQHIPARQDGDGPGMIQAFRQNLSGILVLRPHGAGQSCSQDHAG